MGRKLDWLAVIEFYIVVKKESPNMGAKTLSVALRYVFQF